jgi:dTDP-4-amino-4,6-dideoxygalactose transaminase
LGRLQLKKLDGWVEKRRQNAQILNDGFVKIEGLMVHYPNPESYHSYYKYYAFIEPQYFKAGWTRDRIMGEINARSIPCGVGSCSEIYLEEAFTKLGYGPKGRLPNARQLGETSLMFQVHPTLDEPSMQRMIEVVREVMALAVK